MKDELKEKKDEILSKVNEKKIQIQENLSEKVNILKNEIDGTIEKTKENYTASVNKINNFKHNIKEKVTLYKIIIKIIKLYNMVGEIISGIC